MSFLSKLKKIFNKVETSPPEIVIINPETGKITSPKTTIPLGGHGIDVSHHNTVNLPIVASEQSFIFIKATEGLTFVDDKFHSRWLGLKLLGAKRGAYHFFRANVDAKKQAQFFCNTVGPLDENDLGLVLDMETMDGMSKEWVKKECKVFLDEIESISGKTPIIYSGHSFLVDLGLDQSFERYPLWLARYTDKIPTAPIPWHKVGWTFWQYSETKKINGVGVCDCNYYKGV